MLVDLPEHLFSDATVWGRPKKRVPIDADVEIGYLDTGEEVGDRSSQGGDCTKEAADGDRAKPSG
jgi:hypothetical protein